nr:PREDICTED: nuclear apoptosis-inducing factor 1-like [Stegastes partitus]
MSKKGKKRNFTECELETLVNERSEWESVCEAVNAVGSEQRTLTEVKKKWSDIKVDVKTRTIVQRQSVAKTGGGRGMDKLTPFEQRVAAIVGDTALTGVVRANVGDSDHPQASPASADPPVRRNSQLLMPVRGTHA